MRSYVGFCHCHNTKTKGTVFIGKCIIMLVLQIFLLCFILRWYHFVSYLSWDDPNLISRGIILRFAMQSWHKWIELQIVEHYSYKWTSLIIQTSISEISNKIEFQQSERYGFVTTSTIKKMTTLVFHHRREG